MTSVGAGVEGDQELVTRLARARAGILDLTDANRDIATLVERQATADAPRGATGRLAGSADTVVTADSWAVTYGAPYAVFVHGGTDVMPARPWALDAARNTESRWMGLLSDHVQQLLDG